MVALLGMKEVNGNQNGYEAPKWSTGLVCIKVVIEHTMHEVSDQAEPD
jgi:hypothetical protein